MLDTIEKLDRFLWQPVATPAQLAALSGPSVTSAASSQQPSLSPISSCICLLLTRQRWLLKLKLMRLKGLCRLLDSARVDALVVAQSRVGHY